MADRIKIDHEHVRQIGERFQRSSEQSLTLAKELKSLIDGLTGEWEGASRERFYSSYQDADKELASTAKVLKDVGDELTAIAERFKQADTVK